MREAATPCINASPAEALAGRHMTWNDDRLCARCRAEQEQVAS